MTVWGEKIVMMTDVLESLVESFGENFLIGEIWGIFL